MKRNRNAGTYNVLTFLFIALSIGVCLYAALLASKTIAPPVFLDPSTPTLRPTNFLPSPTITNTASITPTPTRTYTPTLTSTPSETLTPTSTFTLTPSLTQTPSLTVTPSKTWTPSITFTPSNTDTFTPTFTFTPSLTRTPTFTRTPTSTRTPIPSPTKPTATPTIEFPFILDPSQPGVVLTTYQQGCQFQGIVGQVAGLEREYLTPASGIIVKITGSGGFSLNLQVGSDPTYGFLAKVDNKPNTLGYGVQLFSAQGVTLSPRYAVTFPGDCTQNLAFVNFVQIRPF